MAKNKVERLLKRALAKIADRDHWIKHASARDVKGTSVPIHSRKACCFCITGAVERCAPANYDESPLDAVRWRAFEALRDAAAQLYPKRGDVSLPTFNDDPHTTHLQVVKVFKQAIEAVRENPGH